MASFGYRPNARSVALSKKRGIAASSAMPPRNSQGMRHKVKPPKSTVESPTINMVDTVAYRKETDKIPKESVEATERIVHHHHAQTSALDYNDQIAALNVGKTVHAVILAGGKCQQDNPLAKRRACAALPLAGTFRLIDIPIGNCINSGIKATHVVTQWNSSKLNNYVYQTYPERKFSRLGSGFVDVFAAHQTPNCKSWFLGSADAVRKAIEATELMNSSVQIEDVLIIPGEAIHRMNYADLVLTHRQTEADVTIATTCVAKEAASHCGVITATPDGAVSSFLEKPGPNGCYGMECTASVCDSERPMLASMGIYVFKRNVLDKVLSQIFDDGGDDELCRLEDEMTTIGSNVIPKVLREGYAVQAHFHEGYWQNILGPESYLEANLNLIDTSNEGDPFKLYGSGEPQIVSNARSLPPAKFEGVCKCNNSMLCDGSVIRGATISNSIIGPGTIISPNAHIEDTYILGGEIRRPMTVGENSILRRVVCDMNATIGKNVQLVNVNHVREGGDESIGVVIREGVIIVNQSAVVPDGTVI